MPTARTHLRFSVVIATTRGSIHDTLAGLRRQTYRDFEVIVVLGSGAPDPSELGPRVKTVRCDTLNISLARNLGVQAAAGEIVAFIDDDAVPEATWLEALAPAFEDPDVGEVGGYIRSLPTEELQYGISRADRLGRVWSSVLEPNSAEQLPGADPFIYATGTNMALRRSALVSIGGFDEAFAYGYEDADVSVRLLDGGFTVRPQKDAIVYHAELPGGARRADGTVRDPGTLLASHRHFAARHSNPDTAMDAVGEHARRLVGAAKEVGQLSSDELTTYCERVEAALTEPLTQARVGRDLRPTQPFQAFLDPALEPLTVVLLGASEAELESARTLAALGHEVHLIVGDASETSLYYRQEFWLHRCTCDPVPEDLIDAPGALELTAAAALYATLARLHERIPIDVILAPLGGVPGALCVCDERLHTVTLAERDPIGALERSVLQRARDVQNRSLKEVALSIADGKYGAIGASGGAGGITENLGALLREALDLSTEEAARHAGALLGRKARSVGELLADDALWCASDPVFIHAMYRLALGRSADPDGFRRAAAALQAGARRAALVEELAGGPEGRAKALSASKLLTTLDEQRRRTGSTYLSAHWSDPGPTFVAAAYLTLLWRQPDERGKASWCALLENGELSRATLLETIAVSDEAREHPIVAGLSRLPAEC